MIQGLTRHSSSLGGEKEGLGGRRYFSNEHGFRNLKASTPILKNLMDGHEGWVSLLYQCIKMPHQTLVAEAGFCPGHAMHTPKLEPIHRRLSINTLAVP